MFSFVSTAHTDAEFSMWYHTPQVSSNTLTLLVNNITNSSEPRKLERLAEGTHMYRSIAGGIYFVTAIFSFSANALALLIMNFSPRRSRRLNRYLSNLGLSDIIFSVCNIPFTYITLVYNTWWLPDFLCPLTAFVQVLAPTVAMYTLIAIGIGRYHVFVEGQKSLALTKTSHTRLIIVLIWVLASVVSAPLLKAMKTSPVLYENVAYVECIEDWSFLNIDNATMGTLYTEIMFTLTFIFPMAALCFIYGRIGLEIYKHQMPVGNDSRVSNQNMPQTKLKVVKMLLILVVSFIVCWSPAQVSYLLLWLMPNLRQNNGSMFYSTMYYTLYFAFHWLACAHSIINPFIYCFFSSNYKRSDLIAILSCNVQNKRSRHFASSAYNQTNNSVSNRRLSLQSRRGLNESMVTLKHISPPSPMCHV